MKTALAAILLLSSVPVNATESLGDRSNREAYAQQRLFDSQAGYAYEHNCFRYDYREEYIPGTSRSPGYVKSYREKVRIPCGYNSTRNVYMELGYPMPQVSPVCGATDQPGCWVTNPTERQKIGSR